MCRTVEPLRWITDTTASSGVRMQRGELVAGRYELVERLGRGGMGDVWAGRDRTLRRDVAVKLLVLDATVPPDLPHRFEREAVAAAQINHPNVVALHDFGVHEDLLYLVMERVEGATLAAHLGDWGPMEPARVLEVAQQICEALAAAHRARVIHYDIKPHNVMLTRDGRVKVVDFGIAGFVHLPYTLVPSEQLAPAGTPEYGAPEQFLTERGDERSDLYALGSVLFALLTGRPPVTGPNGYAVMRRKLDEEAPSLGTFRPDLPPDLIRLVADLLRRDPARRPPTAEAVEYRLRRLRATTGAPGAAGRRHRGTDPHPHQYPHPPHPDLRHPQPDPRPHLVPHPHAHRADPAGRGTVRHHLERQGPLHRRPASPLRTGARVRLDRGPGPRDRRTLPGLLPP